MESKILKSIGIGEIDPAIFLIVLLGLFVLVLIMSVINIKKTKEIKEKYNKFIQGKDAKSLEDLITKRFEQVDTLILENKNKTVEIQSIFENLRITTQKMGVVKYDAFNEMGGKLSFALALLNKENNGFVINAMHSREGCYTYVKEIIRGESYIPLGEEEKKALDKAME